MIQCDARPPLYDAHQLASPVKKFTEVCDSFPIQYNLVMGQPNQKLSWIESEAFL